jgi:hypothetical protein
LSSSLAAFCWRCSGCLTRCHGDFRFDGGRFCGQNWVCTTGK